uniref:Uncharacterized protein n=1 Tax=Euplotes crassus TaxID=5936 RepID=A0A7S3KGF7_EUPCR
MTTYDKSYHTEDEYQFRRDIFNKNLEIINEHNAQGKSFTLGVNKFTDWTDEEYKAILGYKKVSHSLKSASGNNPSLKAFKATGKKDLVSIDHRHLLEEVQDQGSCGSCWAFSTVAALEGAYAQEFGEVVKFSEAHLAECDKFSGGCMGGFMINGFLFYTQHGPVLEKDYEYILPLGECKRSQAKSDFPTIPYAFRVEDNEDDLYEALSHGIVSVAIQAENKYMRGYRGGVIDGEDCGTELDHGVTLVGYEAETDAWIVRNSWGADWGEDGYFRIKRRSGKGICGINMDTAQPVFHPEDY